MLVKKTFGVTLTILVLSNAAMIKTPDKSDDIISSSTNQSRKGEMMTIEMDKEMPNVDLIAIMKTCNETYKIDMAYMESLNESGSFPDETDTNAKCYLKCLLEGTGVVTSKDDFNNAMMAMIFDGTRNNRQMSDLEHIASSCSEREETDKCEKAYQYMKCFMEMEIQEYEEKQKK